MTNISRFVMFCFAFVLFVCCFQCLFICLELDDVKGIPEFWLTAMKNVDMLAEMIQVCGSFNCS